MCQMAQFVDNDVVQNGRRRQHKPPVKGERSTGAAASPTGFLIPYRDTVIGSAGELSEISDPFRKVFPGGGNVSLCQGSALRVGQVGDRQFSLSVL